jgi:hypothetical protein
VSEQEDGGAFGLGHGCDHPIPVPPYPPYFSPKVPLLNWLEAVTQPC